MKGVLKMKVIHKYLVIALLLSLIFSVATVTAADDMTFEQSNIEDVSLETLSVSLDDNQGTESVEEKSLDKNENQDVLQADDNDQLTAGEGTFSEIRTKIDNATNGSTIYLDAKTYNGDGNFIAIDKNITIIGGTSFNPNQYATLDAKGLSSIINASNGTNVVLKYIKFVNGKNLNGNGAAINARTNLTIENCQFINNTAQNGGAINFIGHMYHIIRHDDPRMDDYHKIYKYDKWFHDEIQYGYYYEYSPTSPYNHMIYYYGDYSRDLYIRENFKLDVNNCYFENNNASKLGGAIKNNFGTISSNILNCIFKDNVAVDGGAIYTDSNSIIKNCDFISNSAINNGGGIFAKDINEYNLPDYNYGSSYYYSKYYAELQYCNFTGNSASKEGGAVYDWDDTLKYCKFISNHASNGGAVASCINIDYSDFTYNYATNKGGAIYSSYADFCNFIFNSALKGGAAYGGTIRDSNCTSNSATEGGAIYDTYSSRNNFISNSADYGGAIYSIDDSVVNCEFSNNKAIDSSSAIYVLSISNFNHISGNKFNSDKTEIFIKKVSDYNGFNIVILDNKTTTFFEGENKIYATVTDNEATKFSCEELIFLVGGHEVSARVIDNYAEVMFNATPDDNNSVVGVKTTSSTSAKVYTATINVIPYYVVIEFDDTHGYIGELIHVPIYVYNSFNIPHNDFVYVNYNNNHRSYQLTNGHASIPVSLPNTKRTIDLIVEYGDTVEVRKIQVLDPDDPVAVIIEMPSNETGYVGRTVTIPVNIHDGQGKQLKGDIHVSYNGQEDIITLDNGQANILISLPVYETFFDLGVSYMGYNSVCHITVVDPTIEMNATITLPHNVSGNANSIISIPVSVSDENGQPVSGNISISYMGQERSKALTGGKTNIEIQLPNHETSFEVIVNYNGNVKTCLVEVINPINHTSYFITVADTYTGEPGKNITIPVSVVDGDGKAATGKIHISYNGHETTENLVNGKADVVIQLPIAETSFEVVFSYGSHVETAVVTVFDSKPHADAVINMPQTKTEVIGKLVMIPVKVLDRDGNPVEGDIAIYYAGFEFSQTLENGSATISINPFDVPSSFELTVAYHNKMAHCFVNIIDPNTNPIDAVITLPENESGHVGRQLIIPITVLDSQNNPLEGDVHIYYLGNDVVETLHNGSANAVITLPDEPTTFNLTVYYMGIEKNCLITVMSEGTSGGNDTKVTIEIEKEIIGHTGKLLTIPVFIHDSNGNGLQGDFLAIYNNNERKITLKEGKANIILTLPGYPTSFDLAILYEDMVKTAKIIVFDSSNPIGDITQVEITNGTVEIPFPADATGDVYITINGKTYPGKIIDGKIVVNITDLPNGKYDATVSYSGDGNYSSSEKIITIIIKDSPIFNPNSPLANVTNVTSQGNGSVVIPFPGDATGSVIVTIGDKNYTGTIINGQVVLDITDLPAGNYTSIVYYSGDGKYNNTIKTIIIIKDGNSTSPTNPMGNTTEAQTNDNGAVEIPFPKDATGEVLVNIDGKYYTGRVIDGKVVLDVKDMPNGNYNASVHYFGDGKYSSSTRTMTIIIRETSNNNNNQSTVVNPPAVVKASKFTAKKKTLKAAKKVKKYSVTLKSGKTPIGKVKVTIKIGKKTFKAKTNAKGKATFKIKKFTVPGKYKAVIKFKGNAQYKPTTKKVKLTIK